MITVINTKKNIALLNEWTPEQFKTMGKAIAKHFSRDIFLRHGKNGEETKTRVYNSFKQIDNILGLAYTSTGMWACYGICNVEAYFDLQNVYQYSYFVMDSENNCYAILQDKDENELIIPL